MIPTKLTYGKEGFKEIQNFLNNHYFKNYTLSIFDIMEQKSIEIICDFKDIMKVIAYVSNIEHDFPAWIGLNELSDSYVVGIMFTRGHLDLNSIYEWKNNSLFKIK